jgi:predicted neuraminidase
MTILTIASLTGCATGPDKMASILPGTIGPGAPGTTDVHIERVFGPEHPARYKHPAAITELNNGDLYLAYFGGSGEYGDDTAVYGSRRPKGSARWTPPKVIADTPRRGEGNPVVWQAPDGLVWLFYVNRYGDTWSSSRIKVKISTDQAHTWSDSFMLTMEAGTMVRGQPIVLSGGDYLLGVYFETGEDREATAPDTKSFFLRYDVKAKTWSETNRITSRTGNLQPSPVQITDDFLIAYCRPGGGFIDRKDSYLVRSESHDGGRTFADGIDDTRFQNPNSAADCIKLKNGHLLLVYNDSMKDRSPLTVAISTDNDKTYPHQRNIMEGHEPFAYPYAIQTKDGLIHIIFTSNDRTVINHATFQESAIIGE